LSSAGLSTIPNPKYQWSFAGRDLRDATNDVLRLCNVQLEQAGDYYVLIKSATSTAVSVPILASRIAVGELTYELRQGPPPVRFIVTGRTSHPARLDHGTDVLSWAPIFPPLTPLVPVSVESIPSATQPRDFYRMKLLSP